jgi:hypothetical protein
VAEQHRLREAAVERVGDLEIDEDVAFQAREWKVERIAWVGLGLVILLALAGLFGHGPISWTSASTDDGSLEVAFERFGRRGGSQDLVITAAASAADGGQWEIDMSLAYSETMDIDSITPQPESVEAVDGAVRYTFIQPEPGVDLEATFSVTPDGMWNTSGDIGFADGPSVRVSHFLFP